MIGSGWLGRELIKSLELRSNVCRNFGLREFVGLIETCAIDQIDLSGLDAFILIGGLTRSGSSATEKHVHESNFIWIKNIIDYLISRFGEKKIYVFGSVIEIQNALHFTKPSEYQLSKIELCDYCKNLDHRNLKYLRLPNIVGERMPVKSLLQCELWQIAIRNDSCYQMNGWNIVRDYLHVQTLADTCLLDLSNEFLDIHEDISLGYQRSLYECALVWCRANHVRVRLIKGEEEVGARTFVQHMFPNNRIIAKLGLKARFPWSKVSVVSNTKYR